MLLVPLSHSPALTDSYMPQLFIASPPKGYLWLQGHGRPTRDRTECREVNHLCRGASNNGREGSMEKYDSSSPFRWDNSEPYSTQSPRGPWWACTPVTHSFNHLNTHCLGFLPFIGSISHSPARASWSHLPNHLHSNLCLGLLLGEPNLRLQRKQ